MTKALLTLAAALFLALPGRAASSAASPWRGDVNLLLGGKHLDKNDWGAVHRQDSFGLMTTWARGGWPVSLAADLLTSRRDALVLRGGGLAEERARATELQLGARKIWRLGRKLRPYVGGGLAVASATLEVEDARGSASDRGTGAGPWVGGGMTATLGAAVNLGFDVRASHADARIFGDQKNAGGVNIGLLLGYHWGG